MSYIVMSVLTLVANEENEVSFAKESKTLVAIIIVEKM